MKKLGHTDLHISPVGLGTADFGTALSEAESFWMLDAFADAGGILLDSANVYGRFSPNKENESEKVLGKWVARGGTRGMLITTKGAHYPPGHRDIVRLSRADIERDLDESLLTLRLDCIDFYWLHRDDPGREVGEILEIMEAFVRAGKIRYYGASNYRADRLRAADRYASEHGLTGFSAVSNQYSPATRNPGVNTNPDPTLVTTEAEEWRYHTESGKPLIPFEATARGYFAMLDSGVPLSPSTKAAYDNEASRATYADICKIAETHACSVQCATIIKAAEAPFQIIPLTSTRRKEHFSDIARALELLSAQN